MKLYYYRCSQPNFGDELNAWMWPRLLPDMFDDREDEIFLGIGSILFPSFPARSRKIVFGAGYGGYTAAPKLDANWTVYFVRGHHTARALGLPEAKAVGDAAILLRSCLGPAAANKRYQASFIPHWESARDGSWDAVCQVAGIHYIDPRRPVDDVLEQIRASEVVVAEAMHGAIVSDALRVPWVPARPVQGDHRMKWFDWASALEIDLRPHLLPASNLLEAALAAARGDAIRVRRVRRYGQGLRRVLPGYMIERAAARLAQLARAEPCLSSERAICSAHQKMLEHLDALRRDQALRRAA
ncbi:polysaccharide pyruvyl transferase family protein [Caldimonas aquatica]|uniref:Polysaccharide pyruvyl transferase family protein n=1 Tax=Caldimonas aquatica TaxID=376175 RepID=A0ABY6MUH6_9BURK|nr:polysaccharide pyruvyl transferase family protein [Schlegelella aquatica]UZD55661.1 polysaccharide pyruvyl transferase family protein [Schlegelella aquatica]